MTGFLPPPPRAAVEAVLADLVTRGLLSARAAAGAGDPAGLPPLGEFGVEGSLPAIGTSPSSTSSTAPPSATWRPRSCARWWPRSPAPARGPCGPTAPTCSSGTGLVHPRPLVATVELQPSARYSTDELLRTLHEARQPAGRSDEGVLLPAPARRRPADRHEGLLGRFHRMLLSLERDAG